MISDYPRSLAILCQALQAHDEELSLDMADWLANHVDDLHLPAFLPDLARLEQLLVAVERLDVDLAPPADKIVLNPSLRIAQFDWQNLAPILAGRDEEGKPGEQLVLVWRQTNGAVRYKNAGPQDLLALKLVEENIDLAQAAREHQVTFAYLDRILERAEQEEYILVPATTIRRDPAVFKENDFTSKRYLSSSAFTLQWHITQACDLHCKHCYDRTSRKAVDFTQALTILDDFRSFCREHHVYGQVTFTGGNPLLYPRFSELYQAASERGFQLAILGNPTSREVLEELQAIQPLEFYQVSLEGLAEHNDHIRGAGHFQRIIEFLAILKELAIYSMVMLTLTRENQEQVLPLAEVLRNQVDLFNFNRLAMVGEGAQLLSAPTQGYEDFLRRYYTASLDNPCMGLKDNHLNALFAREGRSSFGGCTGYGCGAAFNFLSLLAEGEVHACRKFPSYMGNICENTLSEIYHSEAGERYRAGSAACDGCKIRAACGGCLAVTHGMGLDFFSEKDPYCFFS
ncbi:MAG: selenobiotic family peptide radical SAM maturase [Proteobacteria bacterium]|nr:selenobiotic family peptide radical SAM maturase [Pseudomonadota bacterium]MBU1639307.1 selenobiotic family peptide radical SAM maturase [Pseudomonadota bacterium]